MTKLNWVRFDPFLHAHLNAWGDVNPNISKYVFSGTISENFEKEKNDFCHFGMKVALDGNEIVGYVFMGFCKEEYGGKTANLCLPAVVSNPALAGLGYGKKMLEDIVNHAEEIAEREVEAISLSVYSENKAMSRVMSKLPFQKINLGKADAYFLHVKDR